MTRWPSSVTVAPGGSLDHRQASPIAAIESDRDALARRQGQPDRAALVPVARLAEGEAHLRDGHGRRQTSSPFVTTPVSLPSSEHRGPERMRAHGAQRGRRAAARLLARRPRPGQWPRPAREAALRRGRSAAGGRPRRGGPGSDTRRRRAQDRGRAAPRCPRSAGWARPGTWPRARGSRPPRRLGGARAPAALSRSAVRECPPRLDRAGVRGDERAQARAAASGAGPPSPAAAPSRSPPGRPARWRGPRGRAAWSSSTRASVVGERGRGRDSARRGPWRAPGSRPPASAGSARPAPAGSRGGGSSLTIL